MVVSKRTCRLQCSCMVQFADKMWVSSICDCDKRILSVCLRSCSCYICGGFSSRALKILCTKEPNKHMRRLTKQWQWFDSLTFLPCSENERIRKWYNSRKVCHTAVANNTLRVFWIRALVSPSARGHLQARASGQPSNRTDNTVVNQCFINITKGASFRADTHLRDITR